MKIIKVKHLILYLVLASSITPLVHSMNTISQNPLLAIVIAIEQNHKLSVPQQPPRKRRKTGAEHFVAITALAVQSQQDNEPIAMSVEQKQCLVPDCTETYADKTELTKHLLTHAVKTRVEGRTRYRCPMCDNFRPITKSKIIRHIRTHTGERPYKCDHPKCTYTATQKGHLDTHKLTHYSKRPYKCNYSDCNYAAKLKVHLTQHLRIHSGEKPYKCDHPKCTYTATQKCNLKRHIRTHTGEKPYKCDHPECTYAATRNSNLNRHKQTCKFRT